MLAVSDKNERLGITGESGCWPTPKQEMLLRAALLQGPEALDAWQEWRRAADIEALDFGSHRMLPQLHRNLLRHGISSPDFARFRSVYRYYWYQNETLFHRATELMKSLREEGIQTMVLKGAAMVSLYYKDSGLRPMQDFDLIVPSSEARRTMKLLEHHGWRSRFPFPLERIPIRHSTPYEDAERRQVDLHWHVLGECRNFRRDEEFWSGSVAAVVGTEQTRALNATDQLFHICAHGVEWNEVPPIRWIADAVAVLEAGPSKIDWTRFIQLVERHHMALPIHDGLRYLQKTFHAAVPDPILERIRKMPASELERFGYQVRTNPILVPTTSEILRKFRYEYSWLTSGVPSIQQRLRILTLWLQYRWRLESRRQLFALPFKAVRHLARKIFRRSRENIWKRTPIMLTAGRHKGPVNSE